LVRQRPKDGAVSRKTDAAIVDDDPSVREALLDLMGSLGFAAEGFANAQAFRESGAAQTASCLIADVQMPGMSGLQLHNELQSAGNAIPTILITAYPDEAIRARALKIRSRPLSSHAIC
jgi:FixJ family two-component response regulator